MSRWSTKIAADPKVVSIDEHHRKWGRFSHSSASFLQLFPVLYVQSDVLLQELHPVVLEDLSDQLTALKCGPHHTETGGVNDYPPELHRQLHLDTKFKHT